MNIINVEQWDITDPIPTEQTIDFQISKIDDFPNLNYINYNLTESINKLGLDQTQLIINQIFHKLKLNPKETVWTCQHISVDNLKFYGSIVFTPHATNKNKYNSISHYPVNASQRISIKDKNIKASFRGSFDTNIIRTMIFDYLKGKEGCLIKDTGDWHFDNKNKDKNHSDYINDLRNSKIVICPRGTGPSTIRMWEALASGCIPLVISNDYVFPLEDVIDWRKCVLTLPEEQIPIIPQYIDAISDDRLESMQKYGKKVYLEWFSPSAMHKPVIEILKQICK